MNFSTASCIAFITKLDPSSIPTAKLYGKRWAANFDVSVRATCVATRRRIAVGTPRGRSLEWSDGSLWRQNRYTSVKNRLIVGGMLFL